MKTNFFGLLILMTFLWASCSSDTSDNGNNPSTVTPADSIVLSSTVFPTSGTAGMSLIKLKSTASWAVEIDESAKSWVTVEPESGSGGNEVINVKVYVKRNIESNADFRRAVLKFKQTTNDTVAEKFTITQYTDHYLLQDSLVLLKIYNRLGGDNWLRPWNLENPLNTWESVFIDPIDGKNRVCRLEFWEKMGLSGTIPEELAELTELISFGFTDEEKMTGNLPEFLKKIPLQMLKITNCPNIGGVLPSYLQGWGTIKNLVLSNCSFTGIDEDWTGDFPELNSFIISGNKFTGKLERRYIQNMRRLVLAEFKDNNFEGQVPTSFFAGKPLYAFSFRMNRFTGPFPEAISTMPAFEDSISNQKSKDEVCPQQDGYGFDTGTCNDNYVSE